MTTYRVRQTASVPTKTFYKLVDVLEYMKNVCGEGELSEALVLDISLHRTIELKDGLLRGVWEVRIDAVIDEMTRSNGSQDDITMLSTTDDGR